MLSSLGGRSDDSGGLWHSKTWQEGEDRMFASLGRMKQAGRLGAGRQLTGLASPLKLLKTGGRADRHGRQLVWSREK